MKRLLPLLLSLCLPLFALAQEVSFDRYFSDFKAHFGITDMYSGGFYPFPDEETRWAWWARHIYFNCYIDAPKPVYRELLELVRNKNYFVITTNVDHQFQRAGMLLRRITQTS